MGGCARAGGPVGTDAAAGYIAFSVVHCTLGDVAIRHLGILIALVRTRSRTAAHWNWRRIGLLTLTIGVSHTIFSEWMNLSRESWRDSALMPVLRALGTEIGLAPLAQWLAIPPLALWLGRRTVMRLEAKRE